MPRASSLPQKLKPEIDDSPRNLVSKARRLPQKLMPLREIDASTRNLVSRVSSWPQRDKAAPMLCRSLQFIVAVGTSEIKDTKYSARGSAFTTLVLGSGNHEGVPSAGVIAAGCYHLRVCTL